ncbi:MULTISPECIES: SIMPL domain-containing protein [unclassified Mucilaginibacter]|uniref:SIMPL domain-containing protein n=1 Tax=unclassified Mucilaginibacter TaxID=2617802 RepID=UPI002AC9B16A|nr:MULTISPECIES: SIMPL domain-containing protein [unclassified Mucilaginibacter]MEB0263617.1 SIMPL domain-containing protein [Mucilaginibacter sp. 10I4]MEB0278628.1 SIMPL domain-containing protein [Mucilaginibacter sp. 10B2]MEB0299338.1 SIMPL domain-containing protein [Mucilaginibacter sp. 5C4]WPX23418.1 SIMPL domain-containing protein [Mucilaginibacter sp. 5C4]
MKKLFLIATLVATTFGAFAQNADLRRKIEVTGIAEQEVTPDIINVSISLKEYMNGKTKVTISTLEKQLEKAVAEAGIAKEDFTINSLSSWNYQTEKKKNPDFLASKQYGIKFRDLNKFDQILSQVDAKGIQSTNIDSYDYSKINDIKNALKLKALIAARDKAAFLVNGLGDKLGSALNITESDNSSFPQPRNVMFMSKAASADVAPVSDIDVRKIKLSFQINAIFEIK